MHKETQQLKKKIFGLDNKVMRTTAKIFDLMVLNFLFVVSCLPIVTIGPAWLTLCSLTDKVRQGSMNQISRTYFTQFVHNLKQGVLLGSGTFLILVALQLNLWIFKSVHHPVASGFLMATYGISLIVIFILLYVFPISAKYEAPLMQTIKNAFLISFLNIHKTLLLLLLFAPVVVLLTYSTLTLLLVTSIFLFIGFSTIAFLQMLILAPVFEKYQTGNQI